MNNKLIWSKIDVKEKVIEDISKRALELGYDININLRKAMNNKSVREISDPFSPLDQFSLPTNIISELKEIAQLRYAYYRTLKYGNKEFWSSAQRERIIGYEDWFDFINDIINQYTNNDNEAILFLGTADGWEIPERNNKIYAIEQIKESCSELSSKRKDIEVILDDFEEDNLFIERKMKIIVALRCLMPNTRLSKLLIFIENNIEERGYVLISHPMKYLHGDKLIDIDDSENKLCAFRERLLMAIKGSKYFIIRSFRTNIEQFFILQRMCDHYE